jgi:beta-lactamase regulating signal transducer with metallopeptidase domain
MIGPVLDHLWQSTLFAAVAACLTLLLKRNGAHVRYWVWFAASMKFLVPISVLVWAFTPASEPLLPPDLPLSTVYAVTSTTHPFLGAAPVVSASGPSQFDIALFLLGLWMAGAIAILIFWLTRWLKVRDAIRRSVPAAVVAPIPVQSCASLMEPGLVGIFRPVMLLPQGIEQHLSPEEMQAILAHELSHWRRRDNLTATLHMLVEALFWFHPMVWWLGAKLIAERERACDEAVLNATDPEIYASSVLKVCRYYLESPLPCAAGVSGADLKKRVAMMMSHIRAARLNLTKKLVLAATCASVIMALTAAGLTAATYATVLDVPAQEDVVRARADQARPRKAIAYNAADFDRYVGHYYYGPQMITIEREGNRFFYRLTLGVNETTLTPEARNEILPEAMDHFFAVKMPAQFSFVSGWLGGVKELVYHQSGIDRRYKRIDEAEAAAITAQVKQRIRDRRPSPGAAEVLRRFIVGTQAGKFAFADMSPGFLARMGGSRLAGARPTASQRRFISWGELQSITFLGVTPDGMDRYLVTFSKAKVDWWFAPLSQDGKIVWSDYTKRPS